MLTILLLGTLLVQSPDTGRTASGLWYRSMGTGPAMVLLHGANLDSRSWGSLPEALADSHRVVTLDLRSHGQSADANGAFSWIDDVIETLDALQIAAAVLVGHSLGAEVALDVALAHPSRVAGLVLIGPSISGKSLTSPPAGIDALVSALKDGDLARAGDALADMPVMRLHRDTSAAGLVRQIVRQNVRLFRARPDWVRRLSPLAVERLESVAIPTLVLMGDRDPTESNLAGRDLLQRVPRATGRTLAGCGHLVPLDCVDETRRALMSFLRQGR